MPSTIWSEIDVQKVGKSAGRDISTVDAYQILKNIFKTNNRITKTLITEETRTYFCE